MTTLPIVIISAVEAGLEEHQVFMLMKEFDLSSEKLAVAVNLMQKYQMSPVQLREALRLIYLHQLPTANFEKIKELAFLHEVSDVDFPEVVALYARCRAHHMTVPTLVEPLWAILKGKWQWDEVGVVSWIYNASTMPWCGIKGLLTDLATWVKWQSDLPRPVPGSKLTWELVEDIYKTAKVSYVR